MTLAAALGFVLTSTAESQQRGAEVEEGRASSDEDAPETEVEISFPGQYRINAYSVEDDQDGASASTDDQTAARLRLRQSVDIDFGRGLSTHLQLQLDHATDNQSLSDEEIRVRHAVLAYERSGRRVSAGLLPLSDRLADTQFSADWDYNPLAVSVELPLGPARSVRLFAANLSEGAEDLDDDDVVHYQAELLLRPMNRLELVVAGTLFETPDDARTSRDYSSLGIGAAYESASVLMRGLVVYSTADAELFDLERDARGFAGLASIETSTGRLRWSSLFSWAEGREDGGGFLPTMSLVGFNGYWGYTGLLTVQGPTDTGFDIDSVNVSNNGYGLGSLQLRMIADLTDYFSLTAAAGWFGGARVRERSDQVGVDLLLMGSYRVHRYLGVDFGIAAARLEDSVSGYARGAVGGFGSVVGDHRDKVALFARVQAEFF